MNRLHPGLTLALGVAVLLGVAIWAAVPPVQRVVFEDGGRRITVSGRRLRTVALAAARADLRLGEADRIEPALITPLNSPEVTVRITRAVPIAIDDAGREAQRVTLARTVGEALRQQGIALDQADQVWPTPDMPVVPGLHVSITRVRRQLASQIVKIPFETMRRADDNLTEGEFKELQPGAPGEKEITLQTTWINGQPGAPETIGEKVLKEPQPAIMAYGTAGFVARGGNNLRYARSLTLRSTGYTAGPESNPNGNGLTATGIPARRGVVAVDPRVIPLGTRLYVEGYGPALAADTGGAIKGERIDLCFDSVAQADDWGVREVKVYVLAN